MAKRKVESALGLTSAPPDFDISVAGSVVPVADSYALTSDQQRLRRGLHQQLAEIDARHTKLLFAEEKIADVQQHTYFKFRETLETIMLDVQQVPDAKCQPYMDEFAHHMAQRSARQMFALMDVGVAAIAAEAVKPPLLPPPPPKRTKLGRWLLGDG